MADQKITQLSEDTVPTIDDFAVSVDMTSGATKKVKWQSLASMLQSLIMPFVYPVGTVYFSAESTNPNTTLGIGTWEPYAQGRAIVGVAVSGTFAGGGTEVGTERETISYDQMPVHAHGVYDGGHSHYSANGAMNVITQPGSTNRLTLSGSAQQVSWGNTTTSTSGSNIGIYNAGGGQSHNNIQPSITVYAWRRTA